MAGALALTLSACTPVSADSPRASDRPPTDSGEPSSGLSEAVDIAPGRHLWLECRGKGSPTVILQSGIHDSSDYWVNIQLQPPATGPDVFTAIAEHTRVCRYDRPGTIIPGDPITLTPRSTPVEGTRTISDVTSDQAALLDAAGVEGPIILVGHSFGGFLQMYYAQTHPDDVVGLVLVDAFSPRMKDLFGSKWEAYEPILNGGPLQDDPAWESFDLEASIAQADAAPPLADDLPMVVLSKTEPFPLPDDVRGFTSRDLETVWDDVQNGLAQLVPATPHVIAQGSDHYIQVREPDLVTDAILLVLRRAAAME